MTRAALPLLVCVALLSASVLAKDRRRKATDWSSMSEDDWKKAEKDSEEGDEEGRAHNRGAGAVPGDGAAARGGRGRRQGRRQGRDEEGGVSLTTFIPIK